MQYNTPEEIVRANHDAGRPRMRLGMALCALGGLTSLVGVWLGWYLLLWGGAPIFLVGWVIVTVTWVRVLMLKERARG